MSGRLVIGIVLGLLGVARLGTCLAEVPRTLELALFDDDKLARLQIEVEVDEQPLAKIWDSTFDRLFEYVDADGNGQLEAKEAARLPSPLSLRQLLWKQFGTFASQPPAWEKLDANRDGQVDRQELAELYQSAGLGGVLVGVGRPPHSAALTQAILAQLDTDRDRQVSEQEWKAAEALIGKLDGNDDELIQCNELVAGGMYPGCIASLALAAPAEGRKPLSEAASLPLLLLPTRATDTFWSKELQTRQKTPGTGSNSSEQWLAWRQQSPDVGWRVRLGKRAAGTPSLEPLVGSLPQTTTPGRLACEVGRVSFELRSDDGTLSDGVAAARDRFETMFAAADANKDGAIEEADAGKPNLVVLKHLIPIADRNSDGRLSETELTAWLDLEEQICQGLVFVSLLDHGHGLFEVLDANHDGGLSVRELRTALKRLEAADCLTAGQLDAKKLPRSLIATVSRGQPQSPLVPTEPDAPSWFRAMDRNADGDVSTREFQGAAEEFLKRDRDGDGLLSPGEAMPSG